MSLHSFSEKGNHTKLQEYIAAHASEVSFDINAPDGKDAFTALHYAAANGHSQCTSILLGAGADPNNNANKFGTTPLHEAVRGGHEEEVKTLLEAGANVNAQDKEGWSVLHYAILDDRLLNVLGLLISKNADLDAKNVLGQTPLHVACSRGFLDGIITLLQRGASIIVKDNRGQTPPVLIPIQDRQPLEVPSIAKRTISLSSDLKVLVDCKDYSDLSIKVKDGAAYGHKSILSARCEKFKQLLQENPNTTSLEFSDITLSTMKYVLEWIYTGDIEAMIIKDAPPEELTLAFDVLAAANHLRLTALKEFCEAVIMNIMEVGQTVWDIMGDIAAFIDVAKRENSAPFTEFCSQHVIKNFNGIVEGDLHTQLHKNAFIKIVQELSMEKRPEANKPVSRPPSLTGKADEEVKQIEGKNLRICLNIMKNIMRDSISFAFNQPVDPIALGIPDYFDIIKHPMDLGTIKSNLERNLYHSVTEWMADVRLVFQNALTYNPRGSPVAIYAEQLKDRFEQKFVQASFEKPASAKTPKPKTTAPKSPNIPATAPPKSKKRKVEQLPTTNIAIPAASPQSMNGQSAKRPPPVIKKEEPTMTFEEKKRLGESMNQLNSDQLIKAIEIITESKKVAEQNKDNEDDETIDIDMNDVDEVTLRKLERYVYSCLKKPKKEDAEDIVVDDGDDV